MFLPVKIGSNEFGVNVGGGADTTFDYYPENDVFDDFVNLKAHCIPGKISGSVGYSVRVDTFDRIESWPDVHEVHEKIFSNRSNIHFGGGLGSTGGAEVLLDCVGNFQCIRTSGVPYTDSKNLMHESRYHDNSNYGKYSCLASFFASYQDVFFLKLSGKYSYKHSWGKTEYTWSVPAWQAGAERTYLNENCEEGFGKLVCLFPLPFNHGKLSLTNENPGNFFGLLDVTLDKNQYNAQFSFIIQSKRNQLAQLFARQSAEAFPFSQMYLRKKIKEQMYNPNEYNFAVKKYTRFFYKINLGLKTNELDQTKVYAYEPRFVYSDLGLDMIQDVGIFKLRVNSLFERRVAAAHMSGITAPQEYPNKLKLEISLFGCTELSLFYETAWEKLSEFKHGQHTLGSSFGLCF
ncbi:MAG: hypothetical protein QW666_01200 [Candidatus Woesearchaeota archaeon]